MASKKKSKTDYPYLPLGMVTEHFGWSYEHVKWHGWNYIIWCVSSFPGGSVVKQQLYRLKKATREEVNKKCKKLEEVYGPYVDKHRPQVIYKKEAITSADVLSPSDKTIEQLLFETQEKKMKNSKVKNVNFVEENGKYYLDITYILEGDHSIEELHIPRVEIPLNPSAYPSIDSEYEWPFGEKHILVAGSRMNIVKGPDYKYFTTKTIKEKAQKMTVAEIEKKLGYKIEIVSEGKAR